MAWIACSVNDAASALSTLESCLASLHSWFCHNGLALNPSKSEAIIFGTRQRLNSFPRPSVIHILSSSVPISDYINTTLLAFLTTCSSSSFLPCLSRSLTRYLYKVHQHFISYFVWNVHSNWLLVLRVMQENKSGCFFWTQCIFQLSCIMCWVVLLRVVAWAVAARPACLFGKRPVARDQ